MSTIIESQPAEGVETPPNSRIIDPEAIDGAIYRSIQNGNIPLSPEMHTSTEQIIQRSHELVNRYMQKRNHDSFRREEITLITEDPERDLNYVEFNETTNARFFERIGSEAMKGAMKTLATSLNQSTDTWAFMGSTAYAVEQTGNINVLPGDLDAFFDVKDAKNVYENLKNNPEILNLSEPKISPWTGAVVIEGWIQLYDSNGEPVFDENDQPVLTDFEIFGQNTDPAGEKQGLVNPGFEHYDLLRLRYTEDDENSTYMNFFDRTATIRLYLTNFTQELLDYDYDKFNKNPGLKLKHAKRLAKLHQLGITNITELIQAYQKIAPDQMEVEGENILPVITELWQNFTHHVESNNQLKSSEPPQRSTTDIHFREIQEQRTS